MIPTHFFPEICIRETSEFSQDKNSLYTFFDLFLIDDFLGKSDTN